MVYGSMITLAVSKKDQRRPRILRQKPSIENHSEENRNKTTQTYHSTEPPVVAMRAHPREMWEPPREGRHRSSPSRCVKPCPSHLGRENRGGRRKVRAAQV